MQRSQTANRTTTAQWEIGHAISYRLNSGRYVVMRVIDILKDQKDSLPVLELVDWVGDAPPEPNVIEGLGLMPTTDLREATQAQAEGKLPPLLLKALKQVGERGRESVMNMYREHPMRFLDDSCDPSKAARFAVGEHSNHRLPTDRVRVIATGLDVPPSDLDLPSVTGWDMLDEMLEDFGLK